MAGHTHATGSDRHAGRTPSCVGVARTTRRIATTGLWSGQSGPGRLVPRPRGGRSKGRQRFRGRGDPGPSSCAAASPPVPTGPQPLSGSRSPMSSTSTSRRSPAPKAAPGTPAPLANAGAARRRWRLRALAAGLGRPRLVATSRTPGRHTHSGRLPGPGRSPGTGAARVRRRESRGTRLDDGRSAGLDQRLGSGGPRAVAGAFLGHADRHCPDGSDDPCRPAGRLAAAWRRSVLELDERPRLAARLVLDWPGTGHPPARRPAGLPNP